MCCAERPVTRRDRHIRWPALRRVVRARLFTIPLSPSARLPCRRRGLLSTDRRIDGGERRDDRPIRKGMRISGRQLVMRRAQLLVPITGLLAGLAPRPAMRPRRDDYPARHRDAGHPFQRRRRHRRVPARDGQVSRRRSIGADFVVENVTGGSGANAMARLATLAGRRLDLLRHHADLHQHVAPVGRRVRPTRTWSRW